MDFLSTNVDFYVQDPGQKWRFFLIKPTSYEPIIIIINNIINNLIIKRAAFSARLRKTEGNRKGDQGNEDISLLCYA